MFDGGRNHKDLNCGRARAVLEEYFVARFPVPISRVFCDEQNKGNYPSGSPLAITEIFLDDCN